MIARRSSRGPILKKAFSPDPEPIPRRSVSDESEPKRKRISLTKCFNGMRPLSPSNIIPRRETAFTPKSEVLTPPPRLIAMHDDLVHVVSSPDDHFEDVDVTSCDAAFASDSAISSDSGASAGNALFPQNSAANLPEVLDIPDDMVYLEEYMDIYSKVMDIGTFEEGKNLVKINLPPSNKDKLPLLGKSSALYTKVCHVADELIASLDKCPKVFACTRTTAYQLYESSKMVVDIIDQGFFKNFEIFKMIMKQEAMFDADVKRKHSDAIIYNFTFANALQMYEMMTFDIDLAKVHVWLLHRLSKQSLAAYLLLVKYILSIDERLAVYFQVHYPAFAAVNMFNVQQIADPYAELILNLKKNPVLVNSKVNVVISFENTLDDKFRHVGLFSRAFHNIGCNVYHIATHDEKTVDAFVDHCKALLAGQISQIFFIVKIVFQSIAISKKVGSICFMPTIEVIAHKDISQGCKHLVLSTRNSQNHLPTYVDFGFNGLTPNFFAKMYMERIQYFMENIIPKFNLTSL